MIGAQLVCCIDFGTEWLGSASTIIVAVISLYSGVLIAKLNSSLELKKTLYLRKVDVFERAVLQLNKLVNLYLTVIASINRVWDMATLRGEIALLVASIDQVSQIVQSDEQRLRVMFYVKLPLNNAGPLIQETPAFLQILHALINQLQAGLTIDENQLRKFNETRERYCRLIFEEYMYIEKVRQFVTDAILHDKQMRGLLSNDQSVSLIGRLAAPLLKTIKGAFRHENNIPDSNLDNVSRRNCNER